MIHPNKNDTPMQVWANTLTRIVLSDRNVTRTKAQAEAFVRGNFSLSRLSAFEGSGRGVGSVARLAIGLCGERGEVLCEEIVMEAMSVWRRFHSDLKEEGVRETWVEKRRGGGSGSGLGLGGYFWVLLGMWVLWGRSWVRACYKKMVRFVIKNK